MPVMADKKDDKTIPQSYNQTPKEVNTQILYAIQGNYPNARNCSYTKYPHDLQYAISSTRRANNNIPQIIGPIREE
jgi:hypothetical protein